jgi:hypothetical protein
MLALGKRQPAQEKETSCDSIPNTTSFCCGIDLHARTMCVCILHQDGEVVVHRNIKACPDAWLKVIAP